MQLWTFLHILAMFVAVSVALGGELFAIEAVRRRDVAALRSYFRVSDRLEGIGAVALLAGVAFGLLAAWVGGLNLLQGWLVLAYALVAGGVVVGIGTAPVLKRIREAVDANPGDDAAPALDQLLASPLPYVLVGTSSLFLVVVLWVMVFKPSF
jgi:uncharacterized membrane protein